MSYLLIQSKNIPTNIRYTHDFQLRYFQKPCLCYSFLSKIQQLFWKQLVTEYMYACIYLLGVLLYLPHNFSACAKSLLHSVASLDGARWSCCVARTSEKNKHLFSWETPPRHNCDATRDPPSPFVTESALWHRLSTLHCFHHVICQAWEKHDKKQLKKF